MLYGIERFQHGKFMEQIEDVSFIRELFLPQPSVTKRAAVALFGRANILNDFKFVVLKIC